MIVLSRSGRLGVALLVLVAVVGIGVGARPSPVWQVLSTVTGVKRLLPIYSVDTPEKKVSLSFDACWGADKTEELLRVLEQYQVKTTFFLVNIWLDKYPDLARKIAQAGHEIGLHSTTHPSFPSLSEEAMERELVENAALIRQVTGYEPVLFRPPFGAYDNRVITVAEKLGFKTIQWSIDSLDWKDLTADQMFERITKRARPGAIVLMHNNGKHTAEVLPRLLEWFLQEGYRVVPISELLLRGDTYVDSQGVQRVR